MTDAELIKAVAEGVMGWKTFHVKCSYHPHDKDLRAGDFYRIPINTRHFWPPELDGLCTEYGEFLEIPIWFFNPINNPAHRDMVVERVVEKGYIYFSRRNRKETEIAFFPLGDETKRVGWGLNPQNGRAVCLAALNTMEAK